MGAATLHEHSQIGPPLWHRSRGAGIRRPRSRKTKQSGLNWSKVAKSKGLGITHTSGSFTRCFALHNFITICFDKASDHSNVPIAACTPKGQRGRNDADDYFLTANQIKTYTQGVKYIHQSGERCFSNSHCLQNRLSTNNPQLVL